MSYPGTQTAPRAGMGAFTGFTGAGPAVRPVPGATLTDTYGAARSGGRKHEGIDIMAPEGTPIHAVAGGTVVQGFQNSLGGNVVRIQGDDGRFYYYAHMTPGSTDHLRVGQRVAAGQVIGGVGHTGDAAGTPNHLHFQVRENGQWINPFAFLQPLPDIGGMNGATPLPFPMDPYAIDAGAPPSMADADHDGLLDRFEALFGTDPNSADTDHDGLSDAYETAVSHTDAVSADTDHDGITDSYEISAGSDPGKVPIPEAARAARFGGMQTMDSDSDGLSDAYEQAHGTNALAADTDRDGLSDGFEAAAGSNPLSMDSDSDGLTDGFESAAGTLEPMAPIGPGAGVPGSSSAFGAAGMGGAGLGAGALDPTGLGAGGLGSAGLGAGGVGADPVGGLGADDDLLDPGMH